MYILNNNTASKLKICSDAGFWVQFQNTVLRHCDDLQDLESCAKSIMPSLQQYLNSKSKYLNQMAEIQNQKIDGYSFSSTLFEKDSFRVNLTAIKAGHEFPLHDHPDSAGITYILKGRANITLCDTSDEYYSKSQNNLSVKVNKIFSDGEISCFTKDKNNIHGLSALSEKCLMLIVHTNTDMLHEQSFYFSANKEKLTGLQLLTRRLSKKSLNKSNSIRQKVSI